MTERDIEKDLEIWERMVEVEYNAGDIAEFAMKTLPYYIRRVQELEAKCEWLIENYKGSEYDRRFYKRELELIKHDLDEAKAKKQELEEENRKLRSVVKAVRKFSFDCGCIHYTDRGELTCCYERHECPWEKVRQALVELDGWIRREK